jgi:prepilin-type processing-associated H-X9-DG protein
MCPSDDFRTHTARNPPVHFSYSVNATICRRATGLGSAGSPGYYKNPSDTLRITQIYSSAEKILLIDEASTSIDDGCWAIENYNPAVANPVNILSNRHDKHGEEPSVTNPIAGRGNVAYADGHVDFIDRTLCMNTYSWDATWDGTGTPP